MKEQNSCPKMLFVNKACFIEDVHLGPADVAKVHPHVAIRMGMHVGIANLNQMHIMPCFRDTHGVGARVR